MARSTINQTKNPKASTFRGLSLLDRLIPETIKQGGGETLRKARLLVALSMPLTLMSTFGMIQSWALGGAANPIFWINFFSLLGYATTLYLMWRTNDLFQSGLLLCSLLFLGYTGTTAITGGYRSFMLYWSAANMLLVFLLLGVRWAIAYTCLTAVIVIGYFVIGDDIRTIVPPPPRPPSQELAERIIHGVRLFLLLSFYAFLMVLGWIFEVSRRQATEEREVAYERNKALLIEKNTAEASDRAKSEFLAQMSHELRTPLNAIIGYAELIEEEAEEAKVQHFSEDLTKIQSSGHHLLSLIDDLLDLSKIEAGKMEVDLTRFSLTELARELEQMLTPTMAKNDNAFHLRLPEQELTVESDRRKLKQILLNLLGNANKFTSQGDITFALKPIEVEGQPWFECQVKDTGMGIAKEEQPQLFQIFSQASNANPRKHKGSGLGLVIVKRMCQLLGGDVRLESELDQGSTFTVSLPTTSPTSEATRPERA